MTREKFIRLTGWGMILSGVSLLLGFLVSNMDSVLGRSLTGREYDRYESISNILITAGSILLVLGFVGLLLRYGDQSGRAGKIVLIFGIFSGLLSLFGAWALSTLGNEWAWITWFFSFTLIFVCLTLFGLFSIREKLLPRWNALPLVAGIGIPIFVSVTLIGQSLSPRNDWFDNMGVGLVILLVTSMGVGLLGFILQGDPQPEGAPV